MINQQQYDAQLQQIFRLLLENKTQEEIARELHISTRTIARYCQRIEKNTDTYRDKRLIIHYSQNVTFSKIGC